MREQRRTIRVPARIPIEYVVLPGTSTFHGVTLDIGTGGITLQTDLEIRPGAMLQVSLHMKDSSEPIHFIGLVMWSESSSMQAHGAQESSSAVGIKFQEIAPQDKEVLVKFVRGQM